MRRVRLSISDDLRADRRELRDLIAFGFRNVDTEDVEVRVSPARRSHLSFTGRAYPEPPRRPRPHPATRYLVTLALPRTIRNRAYPKTYRYPRMKTAPEITVGDWRERLVALAAHEACHVRQFREGLRRSEVEAERWALEVLRRWRLAVLTSSSVIPARPSRDATEQLAFAL